MEEWGLPGVSFYLKALKTYYPKEMVKTSCFDTDEFAKNILSLLSNSSQYKAMSLEALQLAQEEWEWNDRPKEIFAKIMGRGSRV